MSYSPNPPRSQDRAPYNYPPGSPPPEAAEPRYVPIRPPSVKPVVSYALLGLTIFVFILQMAGQTLLNRDVVALLGEKVNSLILQGQYWRLFTPMFLHGSILHIAFNMYALYIFGPGLERHYGHTRFLLLYLLSGFAGNVVSFIFSPYPSLGSSTAIFGLIGAEGVFIYQNRKFFAGQARSALTQIIAIAAINLVFGMSPGIDNWGHVGGLLGGLIFSWLAGPLLSVEGFPPYLEVKDNRGSRETLLASVSVGSLFAILAVVAIVLRGS